MNLVILDPFTLHQQMFRNDILARDARTHEDEKNLQGMAVQTIYSLDL